MSSKPFKSSNCDLTLIQIKEKKRKFFEEPPPQVMHQTFTTLNLSRPLLKVNSTNIT